MRRTAGSDGVIRELFGRWGEGDFATAGYFDSQVEFRRVGVEAEGLGLDGVWFGVDGMWDALREWLQAWEGFRIQALAYDEGHEGRVLVRARMTARGRLSGLTVDREVGQLFTLRDRKILIWEAYGDAHEAAKQRVSLSEPQQHTASP